MRKINFKRKLQKSIDKNGDICYDTSINKNNCCSYRLPIDNKIYKGQEVDASGHSVTLFSYHMWQGKCFL